MAYNGRRGPNVSDFIANLNAIPSAQDLQNAEDNINFEEDLAMFTNTQFFDTDFGLHTDNFGVDGPGSAASPEGTDMKALDFNLQGDFSFPDFSPFAASYPEGSAIPPPIDSNQTTYPSSSTVESPASSLTTPTPRSKRKSASISHTSPSAPDFEEASRFAAEEDKRRRNTAASARFRVKKKQREQALEKSAKEMNDKVAALEGRINQLETENKWLKNLITEKNDNKEDIAKLWQKFNQENNADRKGSERKDGVGTRA
ncbi:hypothetical protein HYALB_00008541 [Hymenoscyphus albidus]|uniref:BZIP domain-containing protein n=1 Tax=Hymenoscyphus albidus TaxID=595503 RepID=A0A9N9LRW8_9HELO|nr:hypothetical protein HYALB_00008541 [Hymenoscyphus albidus]